MATFKRVWVQGAGRDGIQAYPIGPNGEVVYGATTSLAALQDQSMLQANGNNVPPASHLVSVTGKCALCSACCLGPPPGACGQRAHHAVPPYARGLGCANGGSRAQEEACVMFQRGGL